MAGNVLIATDSAEELKKLVEDDATATFENDPKFVGSDPAATASSENIAVQRDTDDSEDSEEEIEDADSEDEEDDEEEDEAETDRVVDAAIRL